jgi:hypothetical protein
MYFAMGSKTFFYIKKLGYIKTDFFVLYSVQVHSEVNDGNFLPIGEYSTTVKNWQK